MNIILIIAARELKSFFDSLIAYVMIILFLGFSGFFTWLYGSDIFLLGQASLDSFFSAAYWTLFFFIPALSMRLVAEEKRNGTLELILTKPVGRAQFIIGKYLATLVLIAIALLFTLPYYISLSLIGQVDHGAILSGYLGLLLLCSSYIAIGIFASSLTSNQIVAFLSALFIGLFFHLIFGTLASNFTGILGEVFNNLDMNNHFASIRRGVVDSRDLIFFFSLSTLGLYFSYLLMEIKKKNNNIVSALMMIGIFLTLNLLSNKVFFRLDFTSDGIYTLSQSTKDILKEVDEPVTIKAYFSDDLPPHFVKARADFKNLLSEFASLSSGELVYEFKSPSESPEIESEALRAGVEPVMINLREKDQIKQQKAYLGAVVYHRSGSQAISFIRPGGKMEYELSSALKKLMLAEKTPIGLVQGQGQAGIEEFEQALATLEIMYELQEIQIDTNIDKRFNTIAIVAPSASFSVENFDVLDSFLSRGGNLLIAINRVDSDMQKGRGVALNTGLEVWLQKKGLQVGDYMIVDEKCGAINIQEQQGMFVTNRQIDFPYLPIIENFSQHPLTSGIERVAFGFASPVEFVGSDDLKFTPLIKSSNRSGMVKMPVQFYIEQNWTDADFNAPNQTIAAALEGRIAGGEESKIVLITDGDFVLNGLGEQRHPVEADNINLFANSIDWLCSNMGLIELRTRGVSSRPLDELEDKTKTMIKYSNFLAPIIFVILYGIFRFWMRKKLRIKRMNQDFN